MASRKPPRLKKADQLFALLLYCDRAPNGQYENTPAEIAELLDVEVGEIEKLVRDTGARLMRQYLFSGRSA